VAEPEGPGQQHGILGHVISNRTRPGGWLLQLLYDPVDHHGQQAGSTRKEQRDACLFSHDFPFRGRPGGRPGRRGRPVVGGFLREVNRLTGLRHA
jgi:hypothetical protein